MGTSTIGGIAVDFTATSKGFTKGTRQVAQNARATSGQVSSAMARIERGLTPAQQAEQRFQIEVARANVAMRQQANAGRRAARGLQRFRGGSSKAAQGALALSQGLGDAASQFGTQGLVGAMRGAGNNLAQFATLVGGPVAGAVGGLAVALGTVLLPKLIGTKNRAKEAREEMEKLTKALSRQEKQLQARQQRRDLLAQAFGAFRPGKIDEPVKALRDRLGETADQIEVVRAKLRKAREEGRKSAAGDLASANRQNFAFSVPGTGWGFGDTGSLKAVAGVKKQQELVKELNDLRARRKRLSEDINRVTLRQNQLQNRQLGVERQLRQEAQRRARIERERERRQAVRQSVRGIREQTRAEISPRSKREKRELEILATFDARKAVIDRLDPGRSDRERKLIGRARTAAFTQLARLDLQAVRQRIATLQGRTSELSQREPGIAGTAAGSKQAVQTLLRSTVGKRDSELVKINKELARAAQERNELLRQLREAGVPVRTLSEE